MLLENFNVPFKEEIDQDMRFVGAIVIDVSLMFAIVFFVIGVWNLLKKNSYKYIIGSVVSLGIIGITFTIYKLSGLF